jgi:hypothetical protein
MGAGNVKNGFTRGVDQSNSFNFKTVSCHFAFGLHQHKTRVYTLKTENQNSPCLAGRTSGVAVQGRLNLSVQENVGYGITILIEKVSKNWCSLPPSIR